MLFHSTALKVTFGYLQIFAFLQHINSETLKASELWTKTSLYSHDLLLLTLKKKEMILLTVNVQKKLWLNYVEILRLIATSWFILFYFLLNFMALTLTTILKMAIYHSFAISRAFITILSLPVLYPHSQTGYDHLYSFLA